MNAANSSEPRLKFNPGRFGRGLGSSPEGARKQVRFEQDDHPEHQVGLTSSFAPPHRRGRPETAGEHRPTRSCSLDLHSVAIILILIYLLLRDGWASLLASRMLPSHLRSSWPPGRASIGHPNISSTLVAHIEETVHRAMNPVPMRDYALAADGGMVFDELTWAFYGSLVKSAPEAVLDDDTRPGHCWHFSGSRAQVAISLPDFIYPTHVTIDHIPTTIAADIGQAPRRLILWGVVDGSENRQRFIKSAKDLRANSTIGRDHPPLTTNDYTFVELVDFVYNISSTRNVQTFAIRNEVRDLGIDVGLLVLEIVGNWGSDSTCIYRVRVHGIKGEEDHLSLIGL